ncbi:unnamed protein product [Periconia digitata]|uniref:mRNA export factor GLE1 n=1 Tax=Periconia digitata TaxID=1303443 RepID=A0A9W4U3Q1_9PLEO|nr:unnamed protein product [Periconia digitata]
MPARSGTSGSSMNTSTSFSSSWGSSSRQSPKRNSLYSPRGSLIRDPKNSPSRKAQAELHSMLARNDRDFHDRLDKAAAERARVHDEQLAKAAQEHLRIQEGAKLEIDRLVLVEEQEKLRRADAQRKELERLRQEKAQQEAEVQRQRLEAKKKEEELARQVAERQRQIQEADARVQAQRDQEAAAQRQREAADQKAKEAEAAAAAAALATTQANANASNQPPTQSTLASVSTAPKSGPSTVSSQPSTSTSSTSSADLEEIHNKYIELHAQMKKFRKEFAEAAKQQNHPLKGHVGNARRDMRKRLGQIGVDRRSSQDAIGHIRKECFDVALSTPGPTIDIRPYLITQWPEIQNEADAQYPAFLLYVWILFQKMVIQSWTLEADTKGGVTLQEVGLITASLFADPKYKVKGTVPLTGIMLAKLHRRCPMLFGIRGNTTTQGGVVNLGLDRYRGDENAYARSITGVSAGYASLCLRHFQAREPAFPMFNYWRAVVLVLNTKPEDIYSGHYYAIKGLLHNFVSRFLLYYGVAAKAVLRRATKEFPNRARADRPGVSIAADLVRVLADSWKEEHRLELGG